MMPPVKPGRQSCPVCQQPATGRYHLILRRPVELWQCGRCNFVSQAIGPGTWQPTRRPGGLQVDDFLQTGRAMMFPNRLKGLADLADRLRRRLPAGSRLLDVGCGDGTFLQLCRQRGLEPSGIEPEEALANHARQQTGETVLADFYRADSYQPESFDAICLIQSLEHVARPEETLQAACRHLKPGGLVLIEVPSFHSPHWLLWRCSRMNRLINNAYGALPEHVSYFSPSTLLQLTCHLGLKPIHLITGRWGYRYNGPIGRLGQLLDPLVNLLKFGGILYLGHFTK